MTFVDGFQNGGVGRIIKRWTEKSAYRGNDSNLAPPVKSAAAGSQTGRLAIIFRCPIWTSLGAPDGPHSGIDPVP